MNETEVSAANEALVAFAQKLVQTPSLSGEEGAVSKLVAQELEALGYHDVSIDEFGNVIGIAGPPGPLQLILNGHLDHVPPAGMDDPYGGTLVDGAPWSEHGVVLRGRGACDMKGNLAAAVYSKAFLGREQSLARPFAVVADAREETDSYEGIPYLLDSGLRSEYAISCESTQLNVALGHRGKIQFDVVVTGTSSHASRPYKGTNAIYQTLPIVNAIREYDSQLPSDSVYGKATATVIHIESSPAAEYAVVPPLCTMRVDRRYVPAESPSQVEADLKALLARVSSAANVDVTVAFVSHYPLMSIDPRHPLVEWGVAAIEQVRGKPPVIESWDFGVNATFLSAAGIPSIGIGPGNEHYAHSPDEHISVDELVQAGRIYAEVIRRCCTDPAGDSDRAGAF